MGRRFRYEWLAAALAATALGAMGCGGDDAVTLDAGIEDTGTADGTQNDVTQPDAPVTDSPTGGPVASLTATPIDLGNGDCGGATITKTVTINNTGGKALTISATTSGAPFSVAPATSTIAPGASGTFTVSVTIPATSIAGTKLTGTITVTTNDPVKPSITVPVSATPEGATFAFATGSPTSADFGQSKLNLAHTPINLTLKNSGNKAATVMFGTPSNAQFSLSSTPASPAALAPNATVALATGFTPTTLTPSVATSNLTVVGAVCGVSVNKVAFSGQGTVGVVTGWPTQALDFGLNACGGAAPAAKTFTLTNAGTADVTITAVTVGTKGYATDLTVGTKIAPAGIKIVSVTAPAIPFPSSVPGSYADALTITTDVPNDAPHTIPLAEGALGAILAFDTSTSTTFGGFGNVPVGTSASEQFLVTNAGNAPANVATVSALPFGVSEAAFTIGAGSGVPTTHGLAATFTPANTAAQVGSVGVTATGLCQALPSALPLTGTGQNGGISLSTNSLQFSADCNKTAAPKSFTVKNSGNIPMTWTAGLVRGAQSPYALDVTAATLAPGGEAIVTVTPAQIPQTPDDISPSAFADDISITTDIVNDVPHLLSLSETALGAVLSFQPSTPLDFGDVPVNTTSQAQTLTLKNSGNVGTATNLTIGTNNAKFGLATVTGTAVPGTPFTSDVTFIPGSSTVLQNGTLSITTSDAVCAPLPTLTASGTGTLAQVIFTPPNVLFGNVDCGKMFAGTKTVTFTNPGNQDYNITSATLEKGTYFTVSMSNPTGLVPRNSAGTLVITITPKIAIPQTVPGVPDSPTYSDILTVKTNAAAEPPAGHPIDISMGAQGVILKNIADKTWDFGSVNYGSTGYNIIGLRNDGNVPVVVSLGGVSLPVFAMTPVTIQGSSGAVLSPSFTPNSPSQTYSDIGELTVPPTTVFCQPKPNYDVTLTGKGASGGNVYLTGGLAFPGVACNGPANVPLAVTIHNTGNTALNYTTGLNLGTWYDVSGGGVVPADGTATVTVTPKPIVGGTNTYSGSSPYADILFVIVDGVAYQTSISQTARGSDIYGGYSPYAASYANGSSASSAYVYAYNGGNAPVTMTTSVASGLWSVDPPITMAANTGYYYQYERYSNTAPPYYSDQPYQGSISLSGNVCHTAMPASVTFYGYTYPP